MVSRLNRIERCGLCSGLDVCLAAFLCATLAAGTARAQDATGAANAPPKAANRGKAEHDDPLFAAEFASGLEAEAEGSFDRALMHYERALTRAVELTDPAPRLRSLLALGSTHYNLRNYLRSVENLKRAVSDPALPSDRAREAQALIDEAMKQLGQLRIEVRPPPGEIAQIAVQVDGRVVSAPHDVPVEPGSHDVRASAAGFHDLARTVTVAAGESIAVSESLVRKEVASATSRAAWIVGGVAALSLAVGIGAGVYSWTKHDESECRTTIDCTAEDVDDRDAAIVAGNISTAAWIVGGVGAAVSGYLFWQAGSNDERAGAANTRIEIGLARVQMSHAW